jgi:hypothetical protein
LPVVVALSMVRLERPRRSIEGLKVEDEPVIDEFTSEVEPVTAVLALELEPLIELVLEALAAFAVDGLLLEVVPADGVEDGRLALFALELLVPELACESGMQSMWTGLAEWSLALPVLLSASLPALGWFRLLHSGLLADEAEFAVAAGWLAAELALLEALLPSLAKARFAEPSRVARANALR